MRCVREGDVWVMWGREICEKIGIKYARMMQDDSVEFTEQRTREERKREAKREMDSRTYTTCRRAHLEMSAVRVLQTE